MDAARSFLLLSLLCLYPAYSYVVRSYVGIDPDYLSGVVIMLFGLHQLVLNYRSDRKLVFPQYLKILSLFALYALATSIFISRQVAETGLVKYLYSDPFVRMLVAMWVIENTHFFERHIRWSLHLLFGMIVVAAVVSIKQIADPLFFTQLDVPGEFSSIEAYLAFLREHEGISASVDVTHLVGGYRFSIYSWITGISVGIDALAVFSLLFALHNLSAVKRFLLTVCAGLISFLSSARWIMVNFLLICSQHLLGQRNVVWKTLQLAGMLSIALLAAYLTGTALGIDFGAFVRDRLLSDSANTRLLALEVFQKVFRHQPIFGTGAVDTDAMLLLIQGKSSQIHVGWLKLFYYYGLVGGLLYLAFMATLLHCLYHRARVANYWGSFFAVLSFAIANLTLVEFSLYYHGIFLALVMSRYLSNRPVEQSIDSLAETRPARPYRSLVIADYKSP